MASLFGLSKQRSILITLTAASLLLTFVLACSFSIGGGEAEIVKVTLSKSVDKDQKPTEPTLIFGPTDVIYASVEVKNLDKSDVLKAEWFFVDQNQLIDSITYSPPEDNASGFVAFNLTPTEPWPAGKYRVDISLNDKLVQSQNFTVEVVGAEEEAPVTEAAETEEVTPEEAGIPEGYTPYTNATLKLSMAYPSDWQLTEDMENNQIQLIMPGSGDNIGLIVSMVDPIDPSLDLESFAKAYEDELRKTAPDAEVTGQGEYAVGGQPGYELDLSYTDPDLNMQIDWAIIVTIVEGRGYAFLVITPTEKFDEMSSTFVTILGTVQFS
jgi:hypothetical protein